MSYLRVHAHAPRVRRTTESYSRVNLGCDARHMKKGLAIRAGFLDSSVCQQERGPETETEPVDTEPGKCARVGNDGKQGKGAPNESHSGSAISAGNDN